jgi:hypothetical protein
MSGLRIFWRIFFILLIFGLLAAGGLVLFRSGWAQGFQAGVITAGAGEGAPQLAPEQAPFFPLYPYTYGPHFGYPGFFPPFGLCFGIGFTLLLFFLIAGLFKTWSWRRWAGSGRGHTGHGWGYGPPPPWGIEWQEHYERWAKEQEEKHGPTSESEKTEDQ